MQNKINEGRTIKYTNDGSTYIKGGALVVVGDIVGVATTDISAGARGILDTEGVFEVPKASISIPQGSEVRMSDNAVTIALTGVVAGKAWSSAAAGDPTVRVKINV